jgi:hypothetical protein
VKAILKPHLLTLASKIRGTGRLLKAYDTPASSSEVQALLRAQYLSMRGRPARERPHLSEVGFRCYSQYEEDGMLLYIFSLIGTGSKRVVEICAGDGRECMATNLIVHHGWEGVLFDGHEANVRAGTRFFAAHPSTLLVPPAFHCRWFTTENVNPILEEAGVDGNVDLLSLDIDGMDYWVWKAMRLRPRVCIFETSNAIPSDLALAAPYDASFDASQVADRPVCRNASLAAWVKLSREKGYRLVGAHRHGFNAIFMRDDVGTEDFPEVSVASCHDNPWTRDRLRTLWPLLKDLPWIRV